MSILVAIIIIKVKEAYTNEEETFNQFKLNNSLKRNFLGKIFPLTLNLDSFHFVKEWGIQKINGYLIILSPQSICSKCLAQQLETINDFKENIKKGNIMLLMIMVARDKKSGETDLINLYRKSLLTFPASIVDENIVNKKFYPYYEMGYSIYFYIDKHFKILDILCQFYLKRRDSKNG